MITREPYPLLGKSEPGFCPRCGLAVGFDLPPDTPTCNPIRSPECWSFVGTLLKAHSVERRVIRAAERNEG